MWSQGSTPEDPASAELRQLIGMPGCNSDADCRSLAVGRKACGGPERYLAWSVLNADAQALAAAAQRDADAQGVRNGKRDAPMSNCAFVADPGARCAPTNANANANGARQCVLRLPRGPAAAPAN